MGQFLHTYVCRKDTWSQSKKIRNAKSGAIIFGRREYYIKTECRCVRVCVCNQGCLAILFSIQYLMSVCSFVTKQAERNLIGPQCDYKHYLRN